MESVPCRQYLRNLQAECLIGGYLKCPPGWRDIGYTPDYNKFYFIRDGECELVIGEQVIRPRPGQLVLMPAGVKQSYYHISDRYVEKYWCHFTADIGGMRLFDVIRTEPVVEADDCPRLESLFTRLLRSHSGRTVTSLLTEKAALLELIAYYIDHSHAVFRPDFQGGSADFLPVLEYIERHLRQDISVDTLARIAHLHPNYFISSFKNHFGCPPKQYIRKLRIEKAKSLLRTTDEPVSMIAGATGFGDLFYFSRIFKKETGFSPTTFRGYRI